MLISTEDLQPSEDFLESRVSLNVGDVRRMDVPYGTADLVITDPHYEHELNENWRRPHTCNDPASWAEVRRIMRPGAYALVFGGHKTQHRIAVAMEEGGLDVVDTLIWIYGHKHKGTVSLIDPDALVTQEAKLVYEPILVARSPVPPTLEDERREWKFADGNKPTNAMLGCFCIGEHHEEDCAVKLLNEIARDPSTSAIPPYQQVKDVSRFFYNMRSNNLEYSLGISRDSRTSPTVKPIALLRQLIQGLLPGEEERVVLDPYMQAGGIGVAAVVEGHHFIGYDTDPYYVNLARQRIFHWQARAETDMGLVDRVLPKREKALPGDTVKSRARFSHRTLEGERREERQQRIFNNLERPAGLMSKTKEQELLIDSLVERISGILEDNGIKRTDLADMMEVSKGYVSQMLSTKKDKLSLSQLNDIANALGYRVQVELIKPEG